MEEAVQRILRPQRPAVVVRPPLWHEPHRAIVIVTAVIVAVAANLPWLHAEGIGQDLVVTGRNGMADGALLGLIALATAWIVRSEDVARSRQWLFRWLPAILGLAGLAFVLSAVRSMGNQIVIWKHYGATSVYDPGFYAFIAAGLTFGMAAIWVGMDRGLARTTDGAPNDRLVVQRAPIIRGVLTFIGVVVGVIGGMYLALHLGIEGAAVSLPLLGGSILGGALGGVTGSRLGRSLIPG